MYTAFSVISRDMYLLRLCSSAVRYLSLLHYIGAMHAVFGKIARVMMVSLGISAPESLSAAGNIFIGQVRILDET